MATLLDRDQDLLATLREREPTAAEPLITAYGDRAYRLAMRVTGNAQAGRGGSRIGCPLYGFLND
jgi:hypothetical protein